MALNSIPATGSRVTQRNVYGPAKLIIRSGSGVIVSHDDSSNTLTLDASEAGATATWGSIGGLIADQEDLEAALDGKQPVGNYVPWQDNTALGLPVGYRIVPGDQAYAFGNLTTKKIIQVSFDGSSATGSIYSTENTDLWTNYWGIGAQSGTSGRFIFDGTAAWEFNLTPYVGSDVVYHAGNLTKTTLGLGNVDNTSDLDKPISTATQTGLDGKLSVEPYPGLPTWRYVTEEAQWGTANYAYITSYGNTEGQLGVGDAAGGVYLSGNHDANGRYNWYGPLGFGQTPYVGSDAIYHAGNLKFPRARIAMSANLAVPNITLTNWPFDIVLSDTDWTPTLSSGAVTIPSTGMWTISAFAQFTSGPSGTKRMIVKRNGTQIAMTSTAENADGVSAQITSDLTAGDLITVDLFQATGGSMTLANAGIGGQSNITLVKLA